ncbi:MAG: LPP20 family lipoprotein [Hyalangium sp.]|uniref:LPP20 family lipoprotein n=1 Tax=Hyalangium sp. TaxID=2028555 RepID=UPI00389B2C4B
MKRSLWMLALVVPLSAAAQGKDAKPAAPVAAPAAKPEAGVNWEGQILRATGAGAPDLKASNPAQARLGAERAAKMDAFRNLLEQAKGVQISAGHTVGDAMASDEVRGRVEGVVRGFKVVNKRYYSDSGVEMDVEVPLSALTSALTPAPATDAAIAVNTQGPQKYTGLVVDARGLGARPVLAPRLLDAAGKPVYGPEALSADARKSSAVAAWYKSLEDAQKSVLVGEKPLVVKASQLQGSDLVLTEDALKKLTEANAAFLAEGRVAIVTQ